MNSSHANRWQDEAANGQQYFFRLTQVATKPKLGGYVTSIYGQDKRCI